jgi:hypothetical protein
MNTNSAREMVTVHVVKAASLTAKTGQQPALKELRCGPGTGGLKAAYSEFVCLLVLCLRVWRHRRPPRRNWSMPARGCGSAVQRSDLSLASHNPSCTRAWMRRHRILCQRLGLTVLDQDDARVCCKSDGEGCGQRVYVQVELTSGEPAEKQGAGAWLLVSRALQPKPALATVHGASNAYHQAFASAAVLTRQLSCAPTWSTACS